MKPNIFFKNSKFYHLNMHFEVSGYFKNLDWIRLQKVLSEKATYFDIEIQALVMLDTHFHIIIESFSFKENFFCTEVNLALNGQNALNSHCEPIENVSQYLNTYKYIYNNPVQAGLCDDVEKYPYSALHNLLGFSVSYCLIADKLKLIQNPYQVLNWLNTDVQFKLSKINQQNFHF